MPDWTDGYDISDYIDENDLDYDGIVLDEGGDLVNGKPISRGLSYVVRKSAQIKAADPVTYDDKGNVIPLSERFNTKEGDIRFSRELNTSKAEVKLETREYSLDEMLSIYRAGMLSPEYDVLFTRVYDYCKDAGTTFAVEREAIGSKGNPVWGTSKGNRIILSQSRFNNPNTPNDLKARVVLHEMLHSATTYAMRAYEKAIKGGATSSLSKNVYNSCKEIYRVYSAISKNPRFKDEYGIKNAREMVAELSNPVFVDKLKSSYPSVWHKLLEAICEIFGINKTFTNYDKLIKAVNEIITHPDYALSSRYDALVNKNPYYLDESSYETTDAFDDGKASRELDFITDMDDEAIREGREMYEGKAPSDRERLANALESVAQNDIERNRLKEYKGKIAELDAQQEKLANHRE